MEWWAAFLFILGLFMLLLVIGVPVAFAFMFTNLVSAFVFWQGDVGQLILSAFKAVGNFTFVPIPLFVLMGEVMFQSGLAMKMIDVLSAWLGRLPGRLSILAVAAGVVFSTMTGSSSASTAVLGSLLVPEMEKRGYKKPMTLGPIMASGGLAMMMPLSSLGLVLASLAGLPVGKFLIALIIPGLMTAAIYIAYIVITCWLRPDLAPSYEVEHESLKQRLVFTIRHALPLGLIVFTVIGLIFLGVAAPTEAAALGALACFIVAYAYGKMTWQVLGKCIYGTMRITFMILSIVMSSSAFSELLAYTGATEGLAQLATGGNLSPVMVVIVMQVIMLIMGTALESLGIILVAAPIFFPIVKALGLDPLWFGVIMLLNMETGAISPPYGLGLFVMKGVAPSGTTLADVFRASIPYCLLNIVAMALMMIFPQTVTWLPTFMR